MKAIVSLMFAGAALTFAACEPNRFGDADRERTVTQPAQPMQPVPETEQRARAAETQDLDEQRKARLEQQRDQIIDQLYAQYGGGEIARETDSRLVRKLDKAAFRQRCEGVGRGNVEQETARDFEEKFFMQSDVVAKCRQVHQLNEQIDQID